MGLTPSNVIKEALVKRPRSLVILLPVMIAVLAVAAADIFIVKIQATGPHP